MSQQNANVHVDPQLQGHRNMHKAEASGWDSKVWAQNVVMDQDGRKEALVQGRRWIRWRRAGSRYKLVVVNCS